MTNFDTLQEAVQYVVEKLALQAERCTSTTYENHGYCTYFAKDNENRCAIGHLMPTSLNKENIIGQKTISIRTLSRQCKYDYEIHPEILEWFKSIEHIFDLKFFELIQDFHDRADNWTSPAVFIKAATELFENIGLEELNQDKLNFSNWKE
jgi:hypothetical protein